MRPCQQDHFNNKKQNYRNLIVGARRALDFAISKSNQKAIDEQRKRIECFQGLIKQLDLMIDDDKDNSPPPSSEHNSNSKKAD